jgi:hypothetical protein
LVYQKINKLSTEFPGSETNVAVYLTPARSFLRSNIRIFDRYKMKY